MNFDLYGHLTPYEIIEIDLKTFQRYIIDSMNNAEHRFKLFQNYLIYTKELNKIVSNKYYQ